MIDETLTNQEYHEHPAISSTQIRIANKSMKRFKASIDGELNNEPSDAMAFGTMAHEFIVEGLTHKYVDDGLLCLEILKERPSLKNVRSCKEYKDRRDALIADGKFLISGSEMKKLHGMREAIEQFPAARNALKGKSEVSFFANLDGLMCKARADKYFSDGKKTYVLDYKTTSSTDLKEIQNAIARYDYHIQAAHYINVINAVTDNTLDKFFFLFQQKEAPYEVALVELDRASLDLGLEKCKQIYADIKQAEETKVYPSAFGDGLKVLGLPDWKFRELQ